MPKKQRKYEPPVHKAPGHDEAAEAERQFYRGNTVVTARRSLTEMATPIGPGKDLRAWQVERVREKQRDAARAFLVDGGVQPDAAPVYGKAWDRDYNPLPYPEAAPREPDMRETDMYLGTSIGALYQRGFELPDGTWETGERWLVELAGWNLTRKGAEVRSRRRK